MSNYACLYFGTPGEGICGGSLTAGGIVTLDGQRIDCGPKGPFHAADGRSYCSEDCAEQFAEDRTRDAERLARWKTNWCPECGFDNWEHAVDCPKAPILAGPDRRP